MLHRYSEVLNLPVICANDGKKAGFVKEIIFCPVNREVKAFILEHKGLDIKKRVVLFKDVLNLGKDAVIVDNHSCISEMGRAVYLNTFRDEGGILGLKIYSKSGDDLGVVKDVIFDWKTGRIEGVEVSDGLLQDVVQGRSILPFFGKVEFSEENVLVEKEAVEEMVNTGGGIKNRLFSSN
jgi:uncharacterized protein YrrD